MKLNFSLIIKLFLSFCFVGYVGFEIYKTLKEDPALEKQFFINKTKEVDGLQINAGTNTIKLKRVENQWWIEKPLKAKANSEFINQWLENLEQSDAEKLPEDSEYIDLAKYGLHDPLASIYFFNQDQNIFYLNLSATKTYDGKSYLTFNDLITQNIVLISGLKWLDFILKKPIDFLSTKDVIPYTDKQLIQIRFKNVAGELDAQKDTNLRVRRGVFQKNNKLWEFENKSIDGARGLALLSRLKSMAIYGYESNSPILDKVKKSNPVFEVDFLLENKTEDKMIIYDYLKPCQVDEPKKECQFVTLKSAPYPFWVEPEDLKPILRNDFLKK